MKLFWGIPGLISIPVNEEVKKLIFFHGKDKERLVEETILEKYDQYYRLAFSYVHNEADANDIVQNMAYRALRGSKSLKNPEYVQTWLYQILINETFRVLKQPKPFSYEEVVEETGNEGEGREDVYCDIDLQRALDELADQDKLVVELRYFEDMKLEDIAAILDENVNTVKSRLYRSLKKLRGILEER